LPYQEFSSLQHSAPGHLGVHSSSPR
jgi:hypothetical protein